MKRPPKTPLQKAIAHLRTHTTSAIERKSINDIHELRSTFTVFLCDNVACAPGMVVVKLCKGYGVKARLNQWISIGTIRGN